MKHAFFLSLVALSACVSSPPFAPAAPKPLHSGLRASTANASGTTDEAPFEKGAPPITPTPPKPPPQIMETRTKSGVRVLGIVRRDLPLVSFGIALKVAAPDDAVAGFDELVIGSVRRSTKDHEAGDIYSSFDQRAITWDTSSVGARGQLFVLTAVKPIAFSGIGPALDLFGESGLRTEDIESTRDSVATGTRSPKAIAYDTAIERLYPGWSVYRGVDVAAIAKTTVADIRAFATKALTVENVVVAVAGDFDWDRVVEHVEEELANLPHGSLPVRAPPPARPSGTVLIPKQLAQTDIVVAFRGPGSNSAERPALALAREAVGGLLTRSLRLTHGITYGSAVSLRPGLEEPPIVISLSVEPGGVLTAIDGIFDAIENAQHLTDPDVVRDRELAQSQVYENLSTNVGVVEDLARIGVLEQPITWYADRGAALGKVTAADIAAVVAKYFRREAAQIAILGDTAGLTKELEARKLGPFEVLSAR